MMRRITGWVAASVIWALALIPAGLALADEKYSLEERIPCGSVTDTLGRLTDYRLRNSTAALKWAIRDTNINHVDPLMHSMRQGEYTRFVMEHLHFMLTRWPNHYPVLQALIQYDVAGGKAYEFLPTQCYFIRAREFVPDDINVLLIEANYFWKKGDISRAKLSYEQVLAIEPESPDANYSIGLVYLKLGDPEKATEHARSAYAAGYPLPGLRRQLERAGYEVGSTAAARQP